MVLTFLALAMAIPTAVPQPSKTVTRLDGSKITASYIDHEVEDLMRSAKVTGAGVAIFNHGKVAFEKAYGWRDEKARLPLTTDSVMTAASLTKAAFACLVCELAAEGKTNLDRPITAYLPKPLPSYARYADLAQDERYKLITLRMLLSHTAGFPNWRWLTEDKKLRIYFDPGQRFAYSGEGIDLAQLTVEEAMREPLERLMSERLFKRLGMERTSMVWQAGFESNYANAYDESGKSLGPQRRQKADAAGSLQTSLHDYALLLQAIAQGKALSNKARSLMLSPQVRIHTRTEFPSLTAETTNKNDAIRLSYGLGWGPYWTPYGEVFFKEGHDEGFQHYAVFFPDKGTGLLVMTNSSNGEKMFPKLLEGLLRNDYTPLEWEAW